MASSSKASSPSDITFESIVVDLSMHPQKDVVASGTIEGQIAVHSYSLDEKNHHLMTLAPHKKSCRAVQFSPDGSVLFTASKDKSISKIDMGKGAVTNKLKKSHEAPIYSLHVVDNNVICTGDDDGHLKVWDMRQNKTVMDVKENDEFISDMVIDNTNRYLLATSGDGTLTCYDIRKHKMKMQSELFDSEMLSLALLKGDEKVVVGTGEGVLNIFNWGEWGNISDRFPGHPLSIDCIVPITDSLICTGSFDGIVRAVNILPNRFIGVVGEHKDFPVENLSLSHCKKYLASCSHDQSIKFWNIENIENEKVETYRKKAKKNNKPKSLNAAAAAKNDFFADLAGTEQETSNDVDKKDNDSSDSDSDGSDDDSAAEAKSNPENVEPKDDFDDSDSGSDENEEEGSEIVEDAGDIHTDDSSSDSDD